MAATHAVFYENDRGLLVGVQEWRGQALDARKAIRLYDTLKRQLGGLIIRYEDNDAVERWDGITDQPAYMNHEFRKPLMVMNIHHYEDATSWLKFG